MWVLPSATGETLLWTLLQLTSKQWQTMTLVDSSVDRWNTGTNPSVLTTQLRISWTVLRLMRVSYMLRCGSLNTTLDGFIAEDNLWIFFNKIVLIVEQPRSLSMGSLSTVIAIMLWGGGGGKSLMVENWIWTSYLGHPLPTTTHRNPQFNFELIFTIIPSWTWQKRLGLSYEQ